MNTVGILDDKTEIIEIKTSNFALEYITSAAHLAGQDLETFMMAAAFVKADSLLEKFESRVISDKSFDKLQLIISQDEENPKPSAKLIALMKKRNNKNQK